MKTLIVLLIMLRTLNALAQPTYTASNYAQNGDSIYLTSAQLAALNFDTTGAGITWDFTNLTGTSQRKLKFRLPTQVGYTIAQWAYLYNTNNVNLSSTDGQFVQLGGSLSASNPNDYYLKNNNMLQQKASSYEINTNSLNLKIKNVYSAPDIIYHFPINYLNSDSSNSGYTTSIPGVYYRNTDLHRVNVVDGWGTLNTPFGTFSNCLRIVSTVTQIDSFAVDTFSIPTTTITYRELKWLDFSKKYPVLTVKQSKVGNNFITQSVEYLDNQQYFQPTAYFAYYPTIVSVGDTVQFQNLSTNGQTYQWNFNDPASGANNTSTQFNPSHIFNTADTFYVSLIVMNGSLADTLILPVIVNSGNIPTVYFTTNNNVICANDDVQFSNQTLDGTYYQWQFTGGVPASSYLQNPPLVNYATPGIYEVKLIASNSNGTDSLTQTIVVNSLPDASNAPNGFQIFCQNDVSSDYAIAAVNGADYYQWSIYPANAGTVNSDSTSATVFWNNGYIGPLWISAKAINTCGIGAVTDSLQIEITICTNVNQTQKSEVNIFPNPSNNVFNISNLAQGKTDIKIYNSSGILVKSTEIFTTNNLPITMHMDELSEGLYHIQILHSNELRYQALLIIK